MRQQKPEERAPARRFSPMRLAAFRAVERTFSLCGGRRLYRRAHLAPGRFLVRREVVRVPALAPELAGLSVAQLTDLHAGPFLREGDLADVVEATNAERPDLVCLTGDYISHHWSEALTVLDDLARLEAPLGLFAVFGNHDYKDRAEGRIAAAYAERGIRFLRNEAERLTVRGRTVAVVGLEDLEEAREVDMAKARAPVTPGDLEIVLCHNPMGAQSIAREGCALVLAGHTHGRQIDLPWLRELGPQHPGLRVDLGTTTLVVSRGLGVVGAPLRFRSQAEVVVVRFEPRAGS